jgi:hypothetical protein
MTPEIRPEGILDWLIVLSVSEPDEVHGGAVPSLVGDEGKFASERSSIQPRVPWQALRKLKHRSGLFTR